MEVHGYKCRFRRRIEKKGSYDKKSYGCRSMYCRLEVTKENEGRESVGLRIEVQVHDVGKHSVGGRQMKGEHTGVGGEC